MKKKELEKIKQSSTEELSKQLIEMRKKLVGLGVSLYSKGEGNLKEGKMLRRDIAQILTIMQSKKTKIEETDNSSKEAK